MWSGINNSRTRSAAREVDEMRLNYIDNVDCIDGMKEIPDGSVDLIVTDPPYGINYSSRRIKDKSRRRWGCLNDKAPFLDFIVPAITKLKPTGAMFIFTRWDVQQAFIDEIKNNGGRVKSVLIWDKGTHAMGDLRAAFGSRYESCLFIPGAEFRFPGKRPPDIVAVPKVPAAKLVHPNEKPVALIEKLILDTTRTGATVCDLFMGSGTTAVAAIRSGRNYIGFELDPKYHAIAQQRAMDALSESCPRRELDGDTANA